MKIDFLIEGKFMRWIMRRRAEMERPEYKFCQFCGEKMGRREKLCPCCARLTVRNLKAVGKTELLAEHGEPCLCVSERHRESRIPFERAAQEQEKGCDTGTGI